MNALLIALKLALVTLNPADIDSGKQIEEMPLREANPPTFEDDEPDCWTEENQEVCRVGKVRVILQPIVIIEVE